MTAGQKRGEYVCDRCGKLTDNRAPYDLSCWAMWLQRKLFDPPYLRLCDFCIPVFAGELLCLVNDTDLEGIMEKWPREVPTSK